jgi:hypothetical protein
MNAGDTRPTERLERELQASLRPVDPGAEFTAMLQARLAAAALRPPSHPAEAPAIVGQSAPRGLPRRLYSASLALAASSVVALAVGWQLQDLHAQQHAQQVRLQQARIHTQLLLALEITSERLGQAQQRIEQYQSREKSL